MTDDSAVRYYDIKLRVKVFDPRPSRLTVQADIRDTIDARCRGLVVTSIESEKVSTKPLTPTPAAS